VTCLHDHLRSKQCAVVYLAVFKLLSLTLN